MRKAVDEAARESLAYQKDVARKMEDEAVETMKKAVNHCVKRFTMARSRSERRACP
jgi:TRAP-type C4-dicarboxylate transport system substrate-binding protein